MRFAGECAALGTAVCFATGSNLFATAGQRMGSVVLNRLRITTACLLLAFTLLLVRGSPWPAWASASQVAVLSLSGLIGFVFGDSFFFRSLVILGPGRTSLLMSSAPVFTALLAWPTLHETPGPLALIGMALTLGGIAWVLWEREHSRSAHVEGSMLVGVGSGVLAAIGQAGGYVLSKQALRTGLDPLSATVIRITVAMVAIWILGAFQGGALRTFEALRDRTAASFMVAGSFFGPFLGVLLSLTAIKFIDTGVAASITAVYPIFAILIASRLHGEKLTLRTMAGAAVSVAGVVVLFLR